MVNIRRLNEELGLPPDSASQSTSGSGDQFIPRATIQAILDSATASQSTLKLALQSALDSGEQLIPKSTIQSILDSTPQPVPEPGVSEPGVPEPADTRPIWPYRPELIYQRYLAEKEAWLVAHPGIRPARYRTARGLEHYPKRWLNENRRNLGFWRLDLETETLLEDSPNWTDEEVTAWLDWDGQETIRAEQQEEEVIIAAGGFGQGPRHGIRDLWRGIETNIQAEQEKYRFA
jgi:hypothetical protein